MRTYEREDGVGYRVDISYGDFARSLFQTEDDPQVYDKKLDHLESTVMDLGEAPTDQFFDRYQEAREEVQATMPDVDANISSGEDARTGKMTYLTFEADEQLDAAEEEAFLETIEDALTETMAGTVATWYDATREASEYRDEDFSVQVQRHDDRQGSYFMLDTDPDTAGDVMEEAEALLRGEPEW